MCDGNRIFNNLYIVYILYQLLDYTSDNINFLDSGAFLTLHVSHEYDSW